MSLSTPSRREFLSATAATVALPSVGTEREHFCVVELPAFRIVRSGCSRGEAEAYVRSSNYFRSIVGDEPRMVIFRQAPQSQLDGEPIEVEGLPIYLDDEIELARA